ncbi:hypothetical protein CANCADRAFT_115381 [Tortispora caseinolytica NRRL Y-17796]|uniref:Uncharacterized protein n=1 Tax=Tortispora caseinolytica NRRL Y-17796 TaxID=767744 RepID=A0A1E4TGZ3_9ASCO|nr:hypothetical protein CANCADRAFT_115381 [Tortispora caseinolytica NRRL Y-17796]
MENNETDTKAADKDEVFSLSDADSSAPQDPLNTQRVDQVPIEYKRSLYLQEPNDKINMELSADTSYRPPMELDDVFATYGLYLQKGLLPDLEFEPISGLQEEEDKSAKRRTALYAVSEEPILGKMESTSSYEREQFAEEQTTEMAISSDEISLAPEISLETGPSLTVNEPKDEWSDTETLVGSESSDTYTLASPAQSFPAQVPILSHLSHDCIDDATESYENLNNVFGDAYETARAVYVLTV